MRPAAVLIAALLIGAGAPGAPAADQGGGVATSDFAGLPAGPGREAVYYTCRACHSEKQFTQQTLSREDWDELLVTMVRDNGMEEPEPWARTLMLNYLATHFGAAEEDDWAGLPAGPGREEVYNLCQACHSLAIVKQQGLSRKAWNETLLWMIEEQGMPEVEDAEMALMLDYLATYFSIESRTGSKTAAQ